MIYMRIIVSILIFFITPSLYAGFIEVSATGSLRENTVNDDNGSETKSITGSIAYYFFENSAIEVSYTEGVNETKGLATIGASTLPYLQITNYEMLGANFILSFGDKNAVLRPYLKAGMASQTKEIQISVNSATPYKEEVEGEFATGGIGFKLRLSKNWSFKAGYDFWKGPLGEDNQATDTAVRAGISFIF